MKVKPPLLIIQIKAPVGIEAVTWLQPAGRRGLTVQPSRDFSPNPPRFVPVSVLALAPVSTTVEQLAFLACYIAPSRDCSAPGPNSVPPHFSPKRVLGEKSERKLGYLLIYENMCL